MHQRKLKRVRQRQRVAGQVNQCCRNNQSIGLLWQRLRDGNPRGRVVDTFDRAQRDHLAVVRSADHHETVAGKLERGRPHRFAENHVERDERLCIASCGR